MKKRILRNASTSVIQVVLSGLALFFLYRFLLGTIGVARLGIWSAVLATTSVANIANFGLSGSVTRFVAKYGASGDEKSVAGVIETAAISIGLLMGFLAIAAVPFISWILRLVIPEAGLPEARAIMPYSLVSLWLVMVSGVFQAGLDGRQRIDIRNGITVAGTLFYLALCFLLVPGRGLKGLAWSQAAQSAFMLLLTWVILRRKVEGLSLVPSRWNSGLFREMAGYGMNFQLMTVCQMLYDPVTKSLLVKFGGLSLAGYYEMANRMVMQVRALIVSANQVLVPAIAGINEKEPGKIAGLYKSTWQVLNFIAAPLLFTLAALAPVISFLWIGHFEKSFIFFAVFLSAGWLVNTLSGPAYFSNLGTGDLRGNLYGNAAIALLNPVLCYWLGFIYGGYGVAAGWVLSLAAGSILTVIIYNRRNKIKVRELMTGDALSLVASAASGAAAGLVIYNFLSSHAGILLLSFIMVSAYTGVVAWPLWMHPARKQLSGWGQRFVRDRSEVRSGII